MTDTPYAKFETKRSRRLPKGSQGENKSVIVLKLFETLQIFGDTHGIRGISVPRKARERRYRCNFLTHDDNEYTQTYVCMWLITRWGPYFVEYVE